MYTFLRLVRLPNLLIIVLAQFFISNSIIDNLLSHAGIINNFDIRELILLIMMTLFITAGGYIMNDFYDRQIDEINNSGTNLFHKYNSSFLLILYSILNALGIFLGFFLAHKAGTLILGWIVTGVVILLWIYSRKYKKQFLTGNLIVSFLSAFVIIIVWLFEFYSYRAECGNIVEHYSSIMNVNFLVLFYSSYAFAITLLREIVKDIEDRKGDSMYHCRTLPVVIGVRNTKLVIVFFMSAVVLSIVLLICNFYDDFTLLSWYFLCVIVLPMVYLIYRIIIAVSGKDYSFISMFLKIIMLLGIISMLLYNV